MIHIFPHSINHKSKYVCSIGFHIPMVQWCVGKLDLPTDTKDVMIKEDGNGFFEMRRMKAGVGGKTPVAQWHHWPPFMDGSDVDLNMTSFGRKKSGSSNGVMQMNFVHASHGGWHPPKRGEMTFCAPGDAGANGSLEGICGNLPWSSWKGQSSLTSTDQNGGVHGSRLAYVKLRQVTTGKGVAVSDKSWDLGHWSPKNPFWKNIFALHVW